MKWSWLWRSVVGKLWLTIMLLVAVVLLIVGVFLLQYIELNFNDSGRVQQLFVYIGIIGFLLSTLFAFFLSTRITQPLLQLKKAADRVARGDYNTKVVIRSSDELGDLARTFNHMGSVLDEMVRDLNHEKEQLSSILRSMTDAVVTLDAEGVVILANPQGEQLIGEWKRLDWEEEEQGEISRAPGPLRELLLKVTREGRDLNEKIQVQNDVWSVVMAPLKSMGVVRGAVAVMRNVTAESKLEKLRRDFVANVSHEIRTPLSMLQGYSEALLDDMAATPQQRQELAQVIHEESLRMGRLVKDLLDLARMEAGHMNMHFREVNLEELLRRVVRKFQVYARDRGIQLYYEPEGALPVLKQAEEDRLEQVMTNLLDNALRHSSAGSSITVTFHGASIEGTPYAVVAVKDEGQGIPAEDLPYVFERFYKADKARKREANGGTGLGLAIVKNIVEAHRGSIGVQSVLANGTTFTLLLPVEAAQLLS